MLGEGVRGGRVGRVLQMNLRMTRFRYRTFTRACPPQEKILSWEGRAQRTLRCRKFHWHAIFRREIFGLISMSYFGGGMGSMLSGIVSRYFTSGFLHESLSLMPQKRHFDFIENSWRYLQLKMHNRCQQHQWQINQKCCWHRRQIYYQFQRHSWSHISRYLLYIDLGDTGKKFASSIIRDISTINASSKFAGGVNKTSYQ